MAENLVNAFVTKVIENSDYEEMDRIYLTNRVFALVGDGVAEVVTESSEAIELKDQLLQAGAQVGSISEFAHIQESIGAQLMDLMTPSPSRLNRQFWETYKTSPEKAIADFYKQSKQNDYVKTKAIAQNIAYKAPTTYGDLEITINLSKPEKDPKAIAAAKHAVASDYPKCQLCMENEGYLGRINHPARSNHRVIRFQMEGNDWGFQYSPYAYFNEHAIFFYSQHEPMHISALTFERLLTIVETFPGYFAGSNADLPIVGGSILTHEHYQGGRHVFPMEVADIKEKLVFRGFPEIEAGIVNWPMSVIRLRSDNKEKLVALATKVLECWRVYSDETAGVLAASEGEPHHTITPIARRKNGKFELDLVLRDNQTSSEHPDGIYHPHQDVQHIKKENIGLIEVMGLAILPPRLKTELKEVEAYLLGKDSQVAPIHQAWADELKTKNPMVGKDAVAGIVRQAVADIFARVLEDAGVYKSGSEGLKHFKDFISFVNATQA
ncbi:UDP-glucose--hexose-1-phosphate uridylyltransferase [Streptococcus sp. DD12]|uniref:UDP-glucose--hexose-1-phosphate uridylyltransferase n=1 Tax=Streptococcus sp. DD12 TaxID=1777880 RepID=UPI00079C8CBF|nr:UDP-glucose--hexose-1-phosphate uridylyltransferase [Streptococcus sp. DD12]KXT75409.1 Galactose-1-phosphate uridylyltransferase [Streptococcus sp. DD12]